MTIPFDNQQPSIALTQLVIRSGIFPQPGSPTSSVGSHMLGEIMLYAGEQIPTGALSAGNTPIELAAADSMTAPEDASRARGRSPAREAIA